MRISRRTAGEGWLQRPTRTVLLGALALSLVTCFGPANIPGPATHADTPPVEVDADVSAWVNYAAHVNGGRTWASSEYSGNYAASMANNGNRAGVWGVDGGWSAADSNAPSSDWLAVHFRSSSVVEYREISEVDVFFLQDDHQAPKTPYLGQPGYRYAPTSFNLQYGVHQYDSYSHNYSWIWQDLPGGVITGNNQIWRQISFAPVKAQGIRVQFLSTPNGRAQLVELEAWGGTKPPACDAGCSATSSCASTNVCTAADGRQVSCDAYGTCDRGTCPSVCGSLVARQCDHGCTAGGSIATTCGNMGYSCVGGAQAPAMPCTECNAYSNCGARCQNEYGNNSTCDAYACTPQRALKTVDGLYRHQFYLSSPLDVAKTDGTCALTSNDRDDDCLSDAAEAQLARLVAPRLYYDDGETCASRGDFGFTHGWGKLHCHALDLVQVRPKQFGIVGYTPPTVASWANDSGRKWAIVRMIFAYPFQDDVFDHVGDTEMVEVGLYSDDVSRRIWKVEGAWFTHHFEKHYVRADRLASIARWVASGNGGAGQEPYLNVAVEDSNHGSWEGSTDDDLLNHNECSPAADGGSPNHCYMDTSSMKTARENGSYWLFDSSRNVGEPRRGAGYTDRFTSDGWGMDERNARMSWTKDVSGNWVSTAGIRNNTGHGDNHELIGTAYVGSSDPVTKKACGWKCSQRDSAGNCTSDAHEGNGNCDDGCMNFQGGSVHTSYADFCYQGYGWFNREWFRKDNSDPPANNFCPGGSGCSYPIVYGQ